MAKMYFPRGNRIALAKNHAEGGRLNGSPEFNTHILRLAVPLKCLFLNIPIQVVVLLILFVILFLIKSLISGGGCG